MVKGTSNMALAGPHLVKAAVGEDVTAEDMGGSKVHNKISGVADLEVEDDEECIEAVRKYLVVLPVLEPRAAAGYRDERPDRPPRARASTTSCRPTRARPTTSTR